MGKESAEPRWSADYGKIAFPHYDEIKVSSRIAVPPCFFGATPGPSSYIRTAINPRQSPVPRSVVPRGYLRCKRRVRAHEDRAEANSAWRLANNYFSIVREDKQSVAVATNEQPFVSPYWKEVLFPSGLILTHLRPAELKINSA